VKEIEWSKTKGVETEHKSSGLVPDISVEEAIGEIRDLIRPIAPVHGSEFQERIQWEFDPNNLSKVGRALELMFDSGELERDEEGVVFHKSDISTEEVMNDMVEIEVHETFRAGGKEYEEGETYDVNRKLADKAESAGYASEKLEEEEPPELDIETEAAQTPPPEEGSATGEEIEIEPGGGDVWGEMEEKLDTEPETPPKWNPKRADAESGDLKPGDVSDLKGVVKNVGKSSPPNQTPFASVETLDGETLTLWCHRTLRNLFLKNPEQEDPEKFEYNVKVGDKVAVRYTGYVQSGGGRGYLNYRWELYDEDGNPKASG